jgi:coiled-coil domain-containing protein 12
MIDHRNNCCMEHKSHQTPDAHNDHTLLLVLLSKTTHTLKYNMEDRKARLAALATKAGRTKKPPSGDEDASQEPAPRVVNFRNYTPADSQLEQGDSEDPPAKRAKQEEKSVLEKALEEAKADVPATKMEEDLSAIAPKKLNWDLKRDIKPKLDKLDKRTQRAIVELLKQRLEQEAATDLD